MQMPNPIVILTTFRKQTSLRIFLACFCAILSSCDSETAPVAVNDSIPAVTQNTVQEFKPELTASIQQLSAAYLQQIDVDFDAVSDALSALQTGVSDFLDNPTEASLDSARDAWLNAHIAYELTALHRYFAIRVLPDPQGLQLFQMQYQINQWSILPGYIDYVGDYPDSGIVNDTTVLLTTQNLRDQHGVFEVTEATLGYHVIEYLLWGLNENEHSPRPASDYVATTNLTSAQIESGITIEQLPSNRRRQLLSLVTDLLQTDFQSLLSLWDGNNVLVSNNLQAMDGARLLSAMTGSMTDMLTEELLVRSLYPLLNGEYNESIQSPYSHATQNAVSAQLSSLERLLLETRTPDGVTLDSLISSMSQDFADFFYQNFDSSKECLVLLYSNLEIPADSPATTRAEFEIVECINLVSNMIDHLGQVVIVAL